jgi:hypothetical protein
MNIQVALLHYPVYNRQRQVIVSSVTNLDIHILKERRHWSW